MATSKQYAYYLEGNQIAIVEKDVSFDNNIDSKEYGPGVSRATWKSPQSTITDGLEVKYVYAPTYRLNTSSTVQVNKFYINGWTVIDGYLVFLKGANNGVTNWNSAPFTAVGADEYINVVGSSRWSGLHKVSAKDNQGQITTYTKVNKEVAKVTAGTGTEIDFAADADGKAKISGDTGEGIFLNANFSVGDYIYVTSAGASWNGMWKVGEVDSDAGDEANSGIYVTENIRTNSGKNTLSTEVVDSATDADPAAIADDADAVILECYRDFCYIQADITALEDEGFDIDLPNYLQKALVYYVKGKLAEDAGELKIKMYFDREFKKMIEKHENSRISGLRITSSGSHAIR